MEQQAILDELVALLEQNNVTIRYDTLGGGGGGLCKIRGSYIFFLDTQSPVMHRAEIAAEAVSQLLDIEAIYLRPEVRQFVEHCGSE